MERHNCDINSDFASAHPSLVDFVYVVRDKSYEYVADLEAFSAGRLRHATAVDPHKNAESSLYVIPETYKTFV